MAKQPGKRKKDGAKGDATEGLPPLNLDAAGIDVGSAEHYVAVPDRDAEPVRKFGDYCRNATVLQPVCHHAVHRSLLDGAP